jgi:hypothetical protein
MTPAKLTLREEIENLLLARIDRGILIATGNSTSNRTSAAYTPPGPSF